MLLIKSIDVSSLDCFLFFFLTDSISALQRNRINKLYRENLSYLSLYLTQTEIEVRRRKRRWRDEEEIKKRTRRKRNKRQVCPVFICCSLDLNLPTDPCAKGLVLTHGVPERHWSL